MALWKPREQHDQNRERIYHELVYEWLPRETDVVRPQELYEQGWLFSCLEKKTSKDADKKDESSEFKIELAAMTSPEDFASLQEQFESLKD